MPTTTKKTTTKKPATKKPVTKKTSTTASKKTPVTKTVAAQKKPVVVTKKPVVTPKAEVIVKEKTVKNSCEKTSCHKARAALAMILLVINTVLLGLIAFKATTQNTLFGALEEFEAMRVGGQENHNIMKEIYKLDAYRNDQKMRLETTLNALQQMNLNTDTPVEITE